MCGIVGLLRLNGENSIESDKAMSLFSKLLVCSQSRGYDATGMAYFENEDGDIKSIIVEKEAVPASRFVLDKLPKVWPNEPGKIVMGHTRAHTKGSPSNNDNNHPVIDSRGGVAVVHNGSISNDDEVFSTLNLKRDAQVDSEAIPKLIAYEYWNSGSNHDFETAINTATPKLDGGFAYICMSTYEPDKVFVVRNRNPVVMAYVPDLDTVLICSDANFIETTLENQVKYLGLFKKRCNNVQYMTFRPAADTIVKINLLAQNEKEVFSATQFVADPIKKVYGYNTNWSKTYNYDRYEYDAYSDSAYTNYWKTNTQNKIKLQPKPKEVVISSPSVQKTADCSYRTADGLCGNHKFKCYMLNKVFNGRRQIGICP